jgi:hypothetical protein
MRRIERNHLLPQEPRNAMSKGENAETARVLRDDEIDAVAGGIDRPVSTTVTMLDYEGQTVVTYSVVGSWDRR